MANDKDAVRLDIRQNMHPGLQVYDAAGIKVGKVDDYDLRWEYMILRPHPLSEKKLYIPFDTITNIDPREVFVSKSTDDLHRDCSSPPPHRRAIDLAPPDES